MTAMMQTPTLSATLIAAPVQDPASTSWNVSLENVEKVEQGAGQVGNAGETMQSMVTQIAQVSSLIREIAAAWEECVGLPMKLNN